MILPGMRYQDHAWGDVKRVLRKAMLAALSGIGVPALLAEDGLDTHRAALRLALHQSVWADEARLERIDTCNWQGEGVLELATDLIEALFAEQMIKDKPVSYLRRLRDKIAKLNIGAADWSSPAAQQKLGKTIADVWVELRDMVDAHNFTGSTGETISANRIDGLRKVEKHARTVCHILENWQAQPELAGYILGRELNAEPIEVRRVRQGAPCRAEWLLRWSEAFPRFYPADKNGLPAVGPFHTQSKKFTASLENIAQCLRDLDPSSGTYAAKLNPGEGDFLVGRQRVSAGDFLTSYQRVNEYVVEDDDHEADLLPEPAANALAEDAGNDSLAESCDDEDETDDADVQHDAALLQSGLFARPPQDEDKEEESDSQPYSAGLAAFPWPVQLALLLRLAGGRFDDLLKNLLESWDKETDLRKWSLRRLASELSKIEGAVITEYKFNQRIDAAQHELIAATQARLATVRQGDKQ